MASMCVGSQSSLTAEMKSLSSRSYGLYLPIATVSILRSGDKIN